MPRSGHAFRYKKLADEIESKILDGTYHAGEKLPSIRKLHEQLNLSISTVHQAYMELETLGLVEVRPKSGYYVGPVALNRFRPPEIKKIRSGPRRITLGAMVNSVVSTINDPKMLPLGSSVTSADLLPYKHFSRLLKNFSAGEIKAMMPYPLSEGSPELRRQIALRTIGVIEGIGPEDLLITAGCTEAVTLALQVIARPGDTIAIESPTHFGFLQLLKELGMRIVEVATDPRLGVDPDELEAVIRTNPVKACLFIPNFHNPLGALMPDERKKRVVRLLNRADIPVIEDDISSELFYGNQRPLPLKAFDEKDLVITCSSLSKTLAPGLRIGWIIPGRRFKNRISRLKAGSTVACAALDQELVARFLSGAAFERHLRGLRRQVRAQTVKTALAIRNHFPSDIRMAVPKGGPLLWIELHPGVNSIDVYENALDRHIAVLPGLVCSASGRFTNYIRVGCGFPFTPEVEKGIETLGGIIRDLYPRA